MTAADDLKHQVTLLAKEHPIQAGPLFTTYNDLALSVEWHDLRILQLPNTDWLAIIGHKRRSDPLRVILPLPLRTTALRPSSLKAIFSSLASLRVTDVPEPRPPLVDNVESIRRRLGRAELAEEGEASEDVDGVPTQAASDGFQEETSAAPTEAERGMQRNSGGVNPEGNLDLDREMVYTAIVASDSTVVYYRLTKGIKKPSDIPDE